MSLLQYFQEAATDQSKRDSVQIIDGCWQLKITGRDKWQKTCAVACVPADAAQTIDGDTLTVRWPSYADLIFGADGLMAQALPGYEMRPGQLHMARLVQRAIEMGEPFVCEAGTGIGKCLHGDTLITMSDGTQKRIAELINQRPSILQVDESLKSSYDYARTCWNSGHKHIYELTTRLGHKIKASTDHPFRTIDGWKKLGELQAGDRIASIRFVPEPLSPKEMPEHEIKFLAYMLSDGCCTNAARGGSISYTKEDPEIVLDFTAATKALGCEVNQDKNDKGLYRITRPIARSGETWHRNAGIQLLQKYGLAGKGSKDKFIPDSIFGLPNTQLSMFIGCLISGDGTVGKTNRIIEFYSISERMINQLQYLLLRFGIIARISQKIIPPTYGADAHVSWRLTITGSGNIEKFRYGIKLVGRKQQDLMTIELTKPNTNLDVIPKSAIVGVSAKRYGVSTHHKGVSRPTLSRIAESAQRADLKILAESDVYWDQVVSIESLGMEDTYDIEMFGEPNFIANNLIVHNSFSYAAICMAMGKKVIIATSNKALQMQLYNKDIPFLQTLFPGKKMALAQGKSNYVCWENCKAGVSDQRFADWVQSTKTGSIEELTFDYQDANKYTVDDECTGKRCDFYAQCFYFRQKALRNDADVIICNHSLLALNHHFQNAKILPAADVVVVDEAHQLPNYVRFAIGWEYYAGMVRKVLGRVYDRDSVYVGTAENLLLDLENEVVKYSSKFGDKQITIPDDMTFDSGIALAGELYAIANAVWPIEGDVINKDERKKERRAKALRNLANNLTNLCIGTEKGHVRWIDTDTPKITNVPFDVSGFIRSMIEHTFELSDDRDLEDDYSDDEPAAQGKPVYILASATLATPALAGFKRECGITHGFELIAQSPFDYANNALLYVPNGGTPPPNQPDFLQYLVDEVRGLVMSSGGGVFLLFTSWANMKHCSDALRQEFAKHFPVYVQGELPKLEIARRFKADGNAVLFATKSFWEGVDIPGDALRCVIIDKMPFAAPSPLFKAREKTSSNPFIDIALPEMIIDLKQGVGRLVRRSTDRGVIAILDSRIRSKPYGRNIVLKSLPPAKLIHSTAMISEFFADGRKASFPDLTNITVSHIAEPTEDFTLVF